jgi:hypothetical protein
MKNPSIKVIARSLRDIIREYDKLFFTGVFSKVDKTSFFKRKDVMTLSEVRELYFAGLVVFLHLNGFIWRKADELKNSKDIKDFWSKVNEELSVLVSSDDSRSGMFH